MSSTTVTESASNRPSLARRVASACALAAVGVGVLASAATATAATPSVTPSPSGYSFTTLNDQADPTFNQLLGINDHATIVGYFGSGTPANLHPNKGYQLNNLYNQANYINENFPGSQQTQVVGINNHGVTVGFWVDANGDNFGFVEQHGQFTSVSNPHSNATTPFDQLLGVNDHGVAVGFYNDAAGNSHGYSYDIETGYIHGVHIPGATSVVATAINNAGSISGFATINGVTEGFVSTGHYVSLLAVHKSANTQILGINNYGKLVGSYLDAQGNTHGFVKALHHGAVTVDDPNAAGTTVINGLNDNGSIVGFYLDKAGNTDGLLATHS